MYLNGHKVLMEVHYVCMKCIETSIHVTHLHSLILGHQTLIGGHYVVNRDRHDGLL